QASNVKRVSGVSSFVSRFSATGKGAIAQKRLAAKDPATPIMRRQNKKRIAVVAAPNSTLGRRSQPSGFSEDQPCTAANRPQRSPTVRLAQASIFGNIGCSLLTPAKCPCRYS